MDKDKTARAVWAALGTIYIGGILLHYQGFKPRNRIAREVIPVDEPTVFDWANVGAIVLLT
jgi:hypothetical protein